MELDSEGTAGAAQPHAPQGEDDSKTSEEPQRTQDGSLLETSVVAEGEQEREETGNGQKQPRRRLKGLHKKVQDQVCVCVCVCVRVTVCACACVLALLATRDGVNILNTLPTGSVYKMAHCLWKGLGLGLSVPIYMSPGLKLQY